MVPEVEPSHGGPGEIPDGARGELRHTSQEEESEASGRHFTFLCLLQLILKSYSIERQLGS